MMIQEPPDPPVLYDEYDDDDDFGRTKMPDEIMVWRKYRRSKVLQAWRRSGFGYIHPGVKIEGADCIKMMIN